MRKKGEGSIEKVENGGRGVHEGGKKARMRAKEEEHRRVED